MAGNAASWGRGGQSVPSSTAFPFGCLARHRGRKETSTCSALLSALSRCFIIILSEWMIRPFPAGLFFYCVTPVPASLVEFVANVLWQVDHSGTMQGCVDFLLSVEFEIFVLPFMIRGLYFAFVVGIVSGDAHRAWRVYVSRIIHTLDCGFASVLMEG